MPAGYLFSQPQEHLVIPCFHQPGNQAGGGKKGHFIALLTSRQTQRNRDRKVFRQTRLIGGTRDLGGIEVDRGLGLASAGFDQRHTDEDVRATVKAAEQVAERIKIRAAKMLGEGVKPEQITLRDRMASAPDGRSVSLAEVALNALHHDDQEQIMAVGSYMSPASPPPFAAQFAEVTVDTETGQVTVDKLVMAVDSGVIVNPLTASGQIEGGMTQALGYAVCEEMRYHPDGSAIERDFTNYHIFRADEMPELTTIFVETFEPSHPFGVKAVAEIPMDGVAPAVGNAVMDAVGVNIDDNPVTPEKVWKALKSKS